MAISKYQHEQQKQMLETFKQFSDLYRSKVELTGEKIRKVDSFRIPMDPYEPVMYTEQNEVSIKMPQDEFERFLRDFSKCVDLYKSARENPMIREQLNQITMLVELYK